MTATKTLPVRKSRTTRWRVLSLTAVHILIALHITHWLVTGRTVSPVEPSEAMFTLELGQLNAGFVFFVVSLLITIAFGRFFCGWGCHVVALQDLCAGIMKRFGIRPKPFRSRLLMWVPMIAALYMFVWPSFKRWALFPLLESVAPSALDSFQQVAELQYQNSLMTTEFWKTFPHWAVAVPFLLVCGFATVYLLGAKAFCTYGCPYGAFFSVMDRISPGRIVADLDKCQKCGHCTATCTSNVRIHEEIQVYSMVVDSGCMKCMDCVSVCPNGALSFGFSSTPIAAKAIEGRQLKRRYDLSWPEEIALLLLFAAVFFATRGAYGQIPMLMALGIAACMTFLTHKLVRLLREKEVRFHRTVLKRQGKWRVAGTAFAATTLLLLVLMGHTSYMQLRIARAQAAYAAADVSWARLLDPDSRVQQQHALLARDAREKLDRIRPLWDGGDGLVPVHFQDPVSHRTLPSELALRRAKMLLVESRPEEALAILEDVAKSPSARGDDALALRIAQIYFNTGQPRKGIPYLEAAGEIYADHLAANPGDASTRARLASRVYLPAGRIEDAIRELERAVSDAPGRASIHNDLAVAYMFGKRGEDALRAMETAVELAPDDEEYRVKLEELRRLLGL